MSKHFKQSEYACKCGCGLDSIAPEQFVISELVRKFEGGQPYTLSSACRCHAYNEAVQFQYKPNYVANSSKSKHMDCLAVDYPSKKPKELYKFLDNLLPDTYGMGLYSWGVHLDIREQRARW